MGTEPREDDMATEPWGLSPERTTWPLSCEASLAARKLTDHISTVNRKLREQETGSGCKSSKPTPCDILPAARLGLLMFHYLPKKCRNRVSNVQTHGPIGDISYANHNAKGFVLPKWRSLKALERTFKAAGGCATSLLLLIR